MYLKRDLHLEYVKNTYNSIIKIERWKAKGLIVVLFKPSVALQKFCKHTLSATERDVLKSPNM